MVLKVLVARRMLMTVLATDVKTMPLVSIKSAPMSASVLEATLENSARPRYPFVPHQNSALAKTEANVLIISLITLANVSLALTEKTVLETLMIVSITCAR